MSTMDGHEKTERMKAIMHAAFGPPRPLKQVAAILHVSPSLVRIIERRAFCHLADRLLATLQHDN